MRIVTGISVAVVLLAGISACSGDRADDQSHTNTPAATSTEGSSLPATVSLFDADSIVGEPKLVSCTLSGGSRTECLSITIASQPASFKIGPWCPRNLKDGPDVSGIWLEAGRVYDADGAFIQNISKFYGDDIWQMFDPETGKINVTDTEVACRAAARPDVDPAYQNYCVECQMDYLPAGLVQTYVIPLNPIRAASIQPRVDHSGVGIAFSGVRLDAPAPVEDILRAHTLAPFDDCGGHVNPNVGYHAHAVTDCLKEVAIQSEHAGEIGLAMDGYGIYARLNPDGLEPVDLDTCRGHTTTGLGYHYHVASPGANAIISCHTGQTGCALSSADQVCDASQWERRGPPPQPR